MVKKRVFELAREWGVESKTLISTFNNMGVEVKNHMCTIEDEDIKKVLPHVKKANQPRSNIDHREHNGIKEDQERNAQEGRPPRSGPTGDQRSARPRNEGRRQDQAPRQEGIRQEGQRPTGQRPMGAGPRPGGQGGFAGGPRPAGAGPRPAGQGGPGGPRPAGSGPRPGGQGGFAGGPRPAGAGPRPGGQGGFPGGPRPAGAGPRPGGQGGFAGGPRPAGAGPRPGGQGGFAGGPRPAGAGPRPGGPGAGRPSGPRPGGSGGPGGGRPGQGRKPGGPGVGGPRPIPKSAIPKPPDIVEPPKKDGRQRHANNKQAPKDKDHRYDDKPGAKLLHPRGKGKNKILQREQQIAERPKHIVIDESVTVSELSQAMGIPVNELIKKLMQLGVLATINQEIDSDTAMVLASEWDITVDVKKSFSAEELLAEDAEDIEEDMIVRPPVVTVMGHVDHGKTSLLDSIRHTDVIASEAGGITQHIGAYQVEVQGKKITFLDTPGHEAFTAMRARGAKVTDIAILVVAADDGVMPQTIEAINHAKAAEVPIIVAINKIDKPDATPDRVKQELTEHGLVVEEWGGDTIAVPVSAKTGHNLEQLLEMVLIVAEVQDLKANPNRTAHGTVIEAKLDKGRGPVATVLVERGTLNVGDAITAGTSSGKVRAMIDDRGRRVKKAGPSMPVEVLGLSDVPQAGDTFAAVDDEKLFKQVIAERMAKRREEDHRRTAKVSLDDLFKQIQEGQVKDLNLIVKADVQGSVEAIRGALEKLSTDEVRVKCVHDGVGAIKETDVMLAAASNAIIIGFNVRPDSNTRKAAEAQQVDTRLYRVIYDAIEDVKAAMSGLLDPEQREVVLGRAEVRATFKVPKAGTIAGCYVLEGKIARNAEVRVIRDGIVIHEGKLDSLKRFKDDAKEVNEGFECGVGIDRFNDLRENDIIEAFIFEEVKRKIQ
ncbi:translation initiation factor IF-2 [Heliorestis acidaminivorans]|uniref:Translation initiation factor IF-2 n=1 Tax=Heliorestis acidaminivorans TaxID=553427 RepID=A0A6I0F5V3_9FIRM|nr:translation initiation factor IF-2 [Heliorestis acidaminivorans]KAB2954352.1 translation initiation factor IF-2 [Heliorestis acidaminivorans]